MPTVFIGLGTNLGKRRRNLAAARRMLGPELRLTAESTVIETAPWGYPDQPDFLNQVVRAETGLDPAAVLSALQSIEARLGRTPTFRYGPRLIDLDLLYYDDLVLDEPGLTIPHPRLHERDFVLRPLVEIAPDWVHPVLGMTQLELLGDSAIQRFSESAGRGSPDSLNR
jgi:2-amino-4-hydroxy-6-hydroxymethyldihydropteridine diphosphokinase